MSNSKTKGMIIYPAIDILDGHCVRLQRGDYNAVTKYSSDPVEMARHVASLGAMYLHVVDLGAAGAAAKNETGTGTQNLIAQIIAAIPDVKIQVGGGVRELIDVQNWLKKGAARVVIGSLAVEKPDLVLEWMRQVGSNKIVLGLDVKFDAEQKEYRLWTRGWKVDSKQSINSYLKSFLAKANLKAGERLPVLCTDIGVDGMMMGPNSDLYAQLLQEFPQLELIASGGVSGIEDLVELETVGVAGVIIGKAFYEGKINLLEVIPCWH